MRPRRLPDILGSSLWLLPLADMLVVGVSAACSAALYPYLRDAAPLWPFDDRYVAAVMLALVLTPLVFSRLGLYHSHRGENVALELTRLTGGWLGVMVLLAVLAIASKTSELFSRIWMVGWFLIGTSMLWIQRVGMRVALAYLRRRGWDTRDVVIIGSGAEAAHVLAHLRGLRGAGYRVMGYCGDRGRVDAALARLPCVGGYADLAGALQQMNPPPDQVWIALPPEKTILLRDVVSQLSNTTLDCRLVPDIATYNILNHEISQVEGLPVIDISRSPMTGLNRVTKSAEDRLLAVLFLVAATPVMLLIALAIKLDSTGPVLFRQKRHGWNGEEFAVFKFRTMVLHQEEAGRITQARPDDPRVTRLGRFLRRTSLDELPQLLNVLIGSMSIVGPRPHAVEHNEYYKCLVGGYMLRHKVKPGITGWAQINGFRGETETLERMKQRIEYDLYYIEHWSIWFDLAIVALTVVRGFISQRAY